MAVVDIFSNSFITIDIGFRYMKIVQVKKNKHNLLSVVNYGIGDTPKGCIKNGAIKDKDAVVAEISRVIKEHNISMKEAKIVMSGTNIISRVIMIDKVPESEVDKKIWEEIRDTIPVDMNSNRIDYKLLGNTIVDGQEKIKVFVTVVSKKIIDNYISILKELRLKPIAVDIPSNSVSKFFKLNIDDYYPYYAVPQNSEKKTFLLYGLGLDSIYPSTVIREYGTDLSPNPVTGVELDDLTPLFCSNGSMKIFVGNNSAYCYDNDFTLIWSRDFDHNIVSAGMFDNGASIIALEAQNDTVVFIDKQGKDVKNVNLNGQVHDIEICGNSAAVAMGSEVLFYGHTGKQIDHVTIPGMKTKVKFIDEKRAYIISEHEIILHQISKNK
jgi:hypothetical protein